MHQDALALRTSARRSICLFFIHKRRARLHVSHGDDGVVSMVDLDHFGPCRDPDTLISDENETLLCDVRPPQLKGCKA